MVAVPLASPFPWPISLFSAGWMGGHYAGSFTSGTGAYTTHNITGTLLFRAWNNSTTLLTQLSESDPASLSPTEGALLLTGAGNGAQLNVVGCAPSTGNFSDDDGYLISTFTPNGTILNDAPFSFAYVPYHIPGIAAGCVSVDGAKLHGTDNFTVVWDATENRYSIQLQGISGDTNAGAFLVTPFDSSPACLLNWSSTSDGRFPRLPH